MTCALCRLALIRTGDDELRCVNAICALHNVRLTTQHAARLSEIAEHAAAYQDIRHVADDIFEASLSRSALREIAAYWRQAARGMEEKRTV